MKFGTDGIWFLAFKGSSHEMPSAGERSTLNRCHVAMHLEIGLALIGLALAVPLTDAVPIFNNGREWRRVARTRASLICLRRWGGVSSGTRNPIRSDWSLFSLWTDLCDAAMRCRDRSDRILMGSTVHDSRERNLCVRIFAQQIWASGARESRGDGGREVRSINEPLMSVGRSVPPAIAIGTRD